MKIDIGCGKNKKEGFIGIDVLLFPGVDINENIFYFFNKASSDSIEEVRCTHFLEHLPAASRVLFFNELHRIMKTGSQAVIIAPYFTDAAAYGDPTHEWPPISEWTFMYLNKEWRNACAPHAPYVCDFFIHTEVVNENGIAEIKCILTKFQNLLK